jgi:hypothetical protein
MLLLIHLPLLFKSDVIQAGTGKSETMKAALWFAFQHDICGYIGTCSFQWKAALLVRTAHSPAVSSCRFFGIPIKSNGTQKVGQSDSSRASFNSDVRLVFLEEGATSALSFFYVSG